MTFHTVTIMHTNVEVETDVYDNIIYVNGCSILYVPIATLRLVQQAYEEQIQQ